MNELTLSATIENIEAVTVFVKEQLELMDFSMKAQMQIEIAIDEIFGNIARYAYAPNVGEVTVCVDVQETPRSVVITFIDGGIPYDPLSAAEPDITLCAEKRAVGGLGIFMVKKIMDEIIYRYENGKSILSIRKNL